MDKDTLKTVIGIVPGWDWDIDRYSADEPEFLSEVDDEDWSYNEDCVYLDSMPRIFLDALAAAAVRVFEEKEIASIYPIQGVTEIQWEYENSDTLDSITIRGPNRTNNTLEAIAEFVRSGGLDV